MRALIRQADPDVVEDWKWRGVPVWSHGGIICTGETYKQRRQDDLRQGRLAGGPAGLFNSSLEGNTRRAIDVREGEELDEKAFKALVRAAVAVNSSEAGTAARRRRGCRPRRERAARGRIQRGAVAVAEPLQRPTPRCACRAAVDPAEAIRSRSSGERASSSSASLIACGVGRAQQPADAVLDQRAGAARVHRQHRHAARLRLEHDLPEGVGRAREHEHVRARVCGRQLLALEPAEERGAVAQALGQVLALGPVAGEDQVQARDARSRASRKASASRSTPFSCVIRPA